MRHWTISVRRPPSSNICGPSHKGASIASDFQCTHPTTFSYLTSARCLDVSPSLAILDFPVGRGGVGCPPNGGFADLSQGNKVQDQCEHSTLVSRAPVRMKRASTSTSGVSLVVPREVLMTNMEKTIRAKRDSLAILAPSTLEPRFGPLTPPYRGSTPLIRLPGIRATDTYTLVAEWARRRTEVLSPKLSRSLAATIELSLVSPTFQELGPDARGFLEAIAFFPQGVNEENVHWQYPTISDAPKMLDEFCVLSLTYRNDGFVTMLAPLRDHLRPKDPASSSLLGTTKEC